MACNRNSRPHIIKPRPRGAAEELAQSRDEQRIDMAQVGGLSGIREIRRRIRALDHLKAQLGELRPPNYHELDQVLGRSKLARIRREGRAQS